MKRKLDDETFIDHISNHDLILLCETWLKNRQNTVTIQDILVYIYMDKKQVTQVEDVVVVVLLLTPKTA